MRNLYDALQEHLDAAAQEVNKDQIFGVFLYGSQNYGTDLEDSDVDTKAIYIPTFEECLFKKPISKEIKLPNGEHCEIKDIREIMNNIKKQNINFVELLFTQNYLINNSKYYLTWHKYFVDKREQIARYDVAAAIKSMTHQALHTLRQDRTDGKKVSNAYRLVHFLERYIANTPYLSCMVMTGAPQLLAKKLKSEKNVSNEYSTILEASLVNYAEHNYSHLTNTANKKVLDEWINEGIAEMIRKNM